MKWISHNRCCSKHFLWEIFKISTDDDLHCDSKGCETKVELNDYIQIERALKFGVQSSNPPHDPLCHPSYNICHNQTGTAFLRISGTFNRKDVTHIVFSKGNMQATLLVHRAGEEYPKRQWRVLYTNPHMLSIKGDYTIPQPVQVILPFFATEIPECTAYFGPDKVDNVFITDGDNSAENEGVRVKFTGNLSTLRIHGKVITVPYQIEFFGETPSEYFTVAFLVSNSLKFSSFLILISFLTTVFLNL
ncbi:hypothetical protein ACTXT7_010877 [Hymenolepis weldensis]